MVTKRPYLLTGGLVPLIENRHKTKLSSHARDAIRILEKMYFSTTASLLNERRERDEHGTIKYEWEVQFVSDEEIDSNLRQLITDRKTAKPIVSFDDVYCQDLADANYHVTRLQDPNRLTESPQLGPRFANPTLETQVENLRAKFGNEVDVMDIGVFGGDTLAGEINRFAEGGVKIGNIYVMFAGQEGIERIAETGSKLNYVRPVDWVDWLEMRDCVGFDGRKVRMYGEAVDCSRNLFVRYTEKSNSWASIPEEARSQYENMYQDYFQAIKSILACDGIDVKLEKSPEHDLVYDLQIGRK